MVMATRASSVIRNVARTLFQQFGYELNRIDSERAASEELIDRKFPVHAASAGFVLHEYRKADGSFDYEKYRQVQVEGNKIKLDYVWVREIGRASCRER